MKSISKYLISFIILFSLQIFAQSRQVQLELSKLDGRSIPSSLLNKISIDLENESMEFALASLAEQGDLPLNFDRDLLPLEQKISVFAENVPAIEALLMILEQTSSELQITKGGALVILPEKKDRENGKIIGVVTDSTSSEPLIGANVMIKGTTVGAATNDIGEFILSNIKSGFYTIRITYIGYTAKEINISVKEGETIKVDVGLNWVALKGNVVEITAQAFGQNQAINQQLSSNTIKNVVSPERLQENPDANIAEAIGRLPGVSLTRSGGEGSGIVIRGLSSKYTKVQLDGITLPSTNNNTRETSISGISQYAIQGVEVFKAITADMEGDAVAGTINLMLTEAPKDFRSSVTAQGGYNDLNSYWGNYKIAGDISNRFFNNDFGVALNLNMESVNRSNQTLSAGYQTKDIPSPGELAKLYNSSIGLNDIKRVIDRKSATLSFDYRLSESTKLYFHNFFSYSNQQSTIVTKNYDLNSGGMAYDIKDTPIDNSRLFVSSFKVKHNFNLFELDEGFAYTLSNSNTPETRNWTFYYSGNALERYGDRETQSLPLPEILTLTTDTLSDATLSRFNLYHINRFENNLEEKGINAFVNLKVPFTISNSLSGFIKLGGRYKEKTRDRNYSSKHAGLGNLGDVKKFGEEIQKDLPWVGVAGVGTISMIGLDDYNVENFLKGQYNFKWYPSVSRLNDVYNWWDEFSYRYLYVEPENTPVGFGNSALGFYPDWYGTKLNTQKLNDKYYAGYVMGELNWNDFLILIPGIRYEKVVNNLDGWWIESVPYPDLDEPTGHATDATHTNEYWLPNLHLKVKPSGWMQILASFTKTLSRPDYNMLTPNVHLNRAGGQKFYISGNPDLKPELWTNYDLQVAMFSNEVSLVSISGFYKEVKDMIWTPSIYRTSGDPWSHGAGNYFSDDATVLMVVPENHSYQVYLKGLEFEMQANLWFLPNPFNYFTVNVNFTIIDSETKYSFSKTSTVQTGTDDRGRPIFELVSTDTVYSGPMLNQPENIVNLSLGYNYKGFNAWISYQYTGGMILSQPNMIEFEIHKSSFSRWDLQVTQKLPIEGLQVLFNFANINNPIEFQNYLADERPTYLENYGWTADLGIRYEF